MGNRAFRRIASLLVVVPAAVGCLSGSQSGRAFSRDWADQLEREKAFEARKERVRNKEGTLLKTPGGKPLIKVDKEGKPQLNVLKNKRLGAEVDMEGGKPAGEIKYEIKW